MGKHWRVLLKNLDGTPCTGFLAEIEEATETPASPREPAPNGNNDEKMTEPQKRYLFRLLAAQGMEGKAAEEHLKAHFKAPSIKDVPKLAASGYIDQLAKGRKEA
jgi:hypothetical protein